MNPADLPRTVAHAVRCAVEDGELGGVPPERVVVERTRPGGVGEYASPVAFQIAKGARMRPADVAAVLARRLDGVPGIERVEVTGPGFVNFVLPALSAPRIIASVAAPRPAPPAPVGGTPGLRERAVREAVVRILHTQGRRDDAPAPPTAAPLAGRDGDVLARYGADAVLWAVLAVPARETPEFSDRLLVQGEDSEFFRVRYAHARSRALLRNARDLGFGPAAGEVDDAPALLRVLADHPLALEAAAHHRAPERLARHLVELADALLDFQYRVLPQGDEKPSAAHRARLALAEAAGTVLAGGLALLGIDVPERL
ncbi:ArgS-related anticodon-binding protein NrtL [Streptomyces antarcticus]|uniref:ArgS-related anticodon-binding protein NrtL n=1 Tax=Streptomyces antarcticus TaxID=2996458 RepID=UPI00226E7D56|nr:MULTISPECIES: DALR anticodon-binding domain-containing protein [unclassified Streptomyces]MCY0940105.1 DALR anticodon-binding domain-containing protein [Streptomyces sp. H34-AA3]MCZ4080753.1 DALR anticodon-binding domain-containing protein [Streptomyces sp. H34-S5]